jgi:hypothetical protein
MSEFRRSNEYEEVPTYLTKLRTHFDQMAPQMIRRHKTQRPGEKGCWVTTVLPSLVERQIRMSSGNLNLGAAMIESEFTPASQFECEELREFLNSFTIDQSLPLVVVNSVKTIDNAYLIVVGQGQNADQTVYRLGDY